MQFVTALTKQQLKRLNILVGSVRSGKTWISAIVFALWILKMPPDSTFLMTAKTLTSLKRNVLDVIQDVFGEHHFTYSLSKKQATLFNRKIYMEGACDFRAETKIRGLTLSGAYCDEITILDRDFFAMLLSRLSAPGAKLFGTTNPDNPTHWFKTEYLDRAEQLDMLVMMFTIDDNPFLDAAYVRQIKKEYTGVFYKRYILGQWVHSEGLIFMQFADDPKRYIASEKPNDLQFISVGVDFGGNKSKTVFVACGIRRGFCGVTVIEDCKLPDNTTVDSEKLNAEFIRFIRRVNQQYPSIPIIRVRCDSAEQYLINGMRAACFKAGLAINISNARKFPIIQRINFINTLINTEKLNVMDNCTHVINSLATQMWDSKQSGDHRLDDGTCDVDTADAFEYSIEEYIRAFY